MQRSECQVFGSFLRRSGAAPWLWLALALSLAPELARAAAPPPANDSFANAQLLDGDYGTVTNDNTNATDERTRGEPSHAGLVPVGTLWYKWVARATAPVEFDTFNSQCDTVLAVYIIGPGAATNLANVSLIVANDDINPTNPENPNRAYDGNVDDPYQINPYLGPSGVKFNAVANTTYYIVVGARPRNNSGLPGRGLVTLSWAYNSSGVFRFTSSSADLQPSKQFYPPTFFAEGDYVASETESISSGRDDYGDSVKGARITVTRLFGNSGRVNIGFELIDGNALRRTNLHAVGDYIWPTVSANGVDVLVTNLIFDDRETTKSLVVPIVDNRNIARWQQPYAPVTIGGGVVDQISYLSCPARSLDECFFSLMTNFSWFTNVFAFTNLSIDPTLAERSFFVRLTNAMLVTSNNFTDGVGETPSLLAPPRLDLGTTVALGTNDHCTATVLVLENDWDPSRTFFITNGALVGGCSDDVGNGVVNFTRAHHRVHEGAGLVSIDVIRMGIDITKSVEIHYDLDNYFPGWTPPRTTDNQFDLQAGSDYAAPSPNDGPNSLNPDFYIPDTAHNDRGVPTATRTDPLLIDSSFGIMRWNAGDYCSKTMVLNITNNNTPEFNEDVLLNLFGLRHDNDCSPGFMAYSTLTILYDHYPAGALDDGFNPDFSYNTTDHIQNPMPGANKMVYSLVVQSNDQSVIAGRFSDYNTISRYGIARINLDGSLDRSFDPQGGVPVMDQSYSYFISSIAPVYTNQTGPTNQYFVGGSFPSYSGTTRHNIARINYDGSLDTNFNSGSGADGTVYAVMAQPDGKVIIGGDFNYVRNNPRPHIARLNIDGSLDGTFDPGTNGPNGIVRALAVTPGGQLFIGGEFTMVNGLSRPRVALLESNGVVSSSFHPVVGADGPVWAMALQANGKLLIGGEFYNVEFTPRQRLARLNADGSLDTSFSPGAGTDSTIYTILLQSDGRILIGGSFTRYNQTPRSALARLFANGELDTGFLDTAYNEFAGLHKPYFNPYANPANVLRAVGLQSDGKLMIAGGFGYVGGGRFSTLVQTNSAMLDTIGNSRAAYHPRANVARLLGGDTIGPGSMNLAMTNFTTDENLGFLYVLLQRLNGSLGEIESTFSIKPQLGSDTNGIATAGTDYIYNRVNLHYGSSWNGTRSHSDGIFGQNNVATDPLGGSHVNAVDLRVTTPHLFGYQGDRNAPFRLDMPSDLDVFYLGGQNIPLGAALGSTASTLSIHEVDTKPGVIQFSSPTYSVDESGGYAQITLTRTNGTVGPIQVIFATTNGVPDPINGTITAFAGQDYVGVSNIITIGDGQTGYAGDQAQVVVIPGNVSGPDKTVNLYLANPGNGAILGSLSNAVLTIINDGFNAGHLNFASVTYNTNEASPALFLTVTRTGGNAGEEVIGFATSNVTAVAGLNYVGANGYLHWNSGNSTPQTIAIPLLRDYKVNIPDLQFYVNLFYTNVPGLPGSIPGSLGPRLQTLCTINNADFYGRLHFAAPNYYASENGGYATVNVIRTDGSAEGISARLTTSDGAYAFAGLNYLPLTTNLVFNPGEIRKTLTIPILDDGRQNVTNLFGFNVTLDTFSPTNASGYPDYAVNAVINIVDAETFNTPAGALDGTFTPGVGFDNDVYSISLQSDGKILAGGIFQTVGGQPASGISRLLSNGVVDPTFTPPGGANSAVRAVLSQTDGRVLLGGDFTLVNGVARNAIARLNLDGSLDTGFDPGPGAGGQVYALAESFARNGARILYAGGLFANYGGLVNPRAGIVRLNQDGTPDPAYNVGAGVNGTVYAVAAYPTNSPWAGQIIVAGDFTTVNGIVRNSIARLNVDGSLDLSFDPGAGATNAIRAVAIQSDGLIVIGGSFTRFGSNALNRIARLNPNGTVDTSFRVGAGANDAVYALAIQPDNRILVVGQFTRASGVTRNRITRLMPDGSVDPAINFGAGANNYAATVALQPDGKFLIGGGFTQVQGQSAPHIARLYGGSMVGSGAFTFDASDYLVDETGTNVVVTILRMGGTAGPNADGSGTNYITFQTLDNAADTTAVPGTNYTSTNVTLPFPAGETVQQVAIPVQPDQQVTPDLTVHLALTDPTLPATLGLQPNALLTIRNVDSAVSFSDANYLVAENAFDGQATITLQRVGSTRFSSTVQFMTTTKGTAVPIVNYLPVTTNVLFQPGQTEAFVSVPVYHDGIVQADLTVDMVLANASGALLLAPTEATLTIQNTDTAAGHLFFSQTNYTVGEGDGFATIYVLRTNGITGPVSASYMTQAGDAAPGVKYLTTTGIVNFADGDIVSQPIQVPIIDEPNVEGNRIFYLLLTNATGGADIIGVNPVPLTIIDNDVGVSFATNSALQARQALDETNTQVSLDVYRLNAATNLQTTVYYSTSNGTAVAGINYDPLINQQLVFKPGETHKIITMHPRYDPRVTGNVYFTVQLYGATPGVQIADPSTAYITLNDVDTGLSIAETNSPVVENPTFYVMENATNVVITVLRTNTTTGIAWVHFSTADGTATAPADYTATNGVLAFTNNQASNSFSVLIVDNLLVDGERYFTVSLSPATNVVPYPPQFLTPSNATVVILDNDSGLSFSSAGYDVTEGGNAVVTVLRTGSTNGTVYVNYSTTSGGTAKSTDYEATSGTLVFGDGVTATNFIVQTVDNSTIEGDRTVLLVLSYPQPTNSTVLVTPSAATLTIHDNDGNLVIPAGTRLLSETSTNLDLTQTNVIHPGDVVSMLFAFRNAAGSSNVLSLQATLLATNGIVNPAAGRAIGGSPTTNYGLLALDGPAVARPFTFKANGTNGQTITATFYLTDSGRMVGSNGLALFNFKLGSRSQAFTNSSLIVINDASPTAASTATPYPSQVLVTNLDGVISRASVTFSNLNHESPRDIEALLASPAGQPVLLMAGVGGSYGVQRLNLTFDDGTNNPPLPYNSPITSGTYQPTNYVTPVPFPTPAPQPPSGSFYTNRLAAFNGSNPNGLWSLHLLDVLYQGGGFITNGWSVNLTVVNPVDNAADLGLYLTTTNNPVIFSSNIFYTLTLTNYGPADATGINLTNFLPAGAVLLTNSITPADAPVLTNGQGALVWSPGSLNYGSFLKLSFAVSNTLAAGTLTNTAVVSAATPDLNLDNNTAAIVTTAVSPSADLAISVLGNSDPVSLGQDLTYTIAVTNLGPGTAPNVRVTNTLPANVSFLSASPNYLQLGNQIVFTNLGSIGYPGSTVATITVQPGVVGTLTNTATCVSGVTDPRKLNNTATIKTVVIAPPGMIVSLPRFAMAVSGNASVLTWSNALPCVVEQTITLFPPQWIPIATNPPGQNTYTVPYQPGNAPTFFRLRALAP